MCLVWLVNEIGPLPFVVSHQPEEMFKERRMSRSTDYWFVWQNSADFQIAQRLEVHRWVKRPTLGRVTEQHNIQKRKQGWRQTIDDVNEESGRVHEYGQFCTCLLLSPFSRIVFAFRLVGEGIKSAHIYIHRNVLIINPIDFFLAQTWYRNKFISFRMRPL